MLERNMIFSTHKNSFRIKKAFEWGIENWLISGGTENPFQCNVFAKMGSTFGDLGGT